MDLKMILALIGGGIGLLVIAFVSLSIFLSKRKGKKLKETLKKYKEESKNIDEQPSNVTIAGEEPIIEDYKEEKEEPVIEDFTDLDLLGLNGKADVPQTTKFQAPPKAERWEDYALFDGKSKNKNFMPSFDDLDLGFNGKEKVKKVDEFEDFLDEYSYTRKIIDRKMLRKLNSLTPEMRAMILGNIFNKYD